MVARETSIEEGLRELGTRVTIPAHSAEKLVKFGELLNVEAVPRGFLGIREQDRIFPRHVLESAAVVQFVPDAGLLIDVGSGAGLPGVALACLRESPVVLIESRGRRCAFLRRVVAELGLNAVDVVQARAELAAKGALRRQASAAIARALAPPAEALELILPFVEVGGLALLLVGPLEEQELDLVSAAGDELGGGPPRMTEFEVPGVAERRWVMIVPKLRETSDRFPRPPTARARRPLGVLRK
jgi:16S rRNA (guanine527-N7)-methyltransferase